MRRSFIIITLMDVKKIACVASSVMVEAFEAPSGLSTKGEAAKGFGSCINSLLRCFYFHLAY